MIWSKSCFCSSRTAPTAPISTDRRFEFAMVETTPSSLELKCFWSEVRLSLSNFCPNRMCQCHKNLSLASSQALKFSTIVALLVRQHEKPHSVRISCSACCSITRKASVSEQQNRSSRCKNYLEQKVRIESVPRMWLVNMSIFISKAKRHLYIYAYH